MYTHLTTTAGRSITSRWMQWALVLLVVAAFGIRLYNLNAKSLWSDEGLSLQRAQQPVSLIPQNLNLIPTGPDYHNGTTQEPMIKSHDLHPPLYFLLMHFWIQVAGKSEFALRFPSVVGATLALPLFYALTHTLLSRKAGFWAALLSASSPFYLWHAQEVRMYTWVVTLSLASVYALLPLLENAPRRRDYLVYIATTLALSYTHYSGFLLAAFEVIVYGAYRLRKRPREALIILGVLAVAFAPLAPYLWNLFQRSIFGFAHRPLHLILAEACSAFSLGLGEPVIRPLWKMAPFLILFAAGILMTKVKRRQRACTICLGYLILPILLLYILSLLKPNYMNPRHLMVASPAWEIILAQGLATLQRRRLWPGLVIILGLVFLLRGKANYEIFTANSMWKDDIRGAAEYIEARAQPGDAIILHDAVIRPTFDYYYKGPHPEIAIPRYDRMGNLKQAQEEFAAWAERYDRIWFLYGPPPIYFPRDFLPNWADANLFKVCEQKFEAWWTYVAVAAYDDGPPTFEGLPTGVEPRDSAWGPLRLVGFRAPEATAGENAWLEFYWRAEGDPPDEPLTLAVELKDEAGAVWLKRTELTLPFYPPTQWPTDKIVMTEFRLPLPEDMPPIDFAVEVEPVSLRGAVTAGQVPVVRPGARDPAPSPKARFEGGIELLSSQLAGDKFRAGYPLVGSLSWGAARAPAADYRLRVRLTDLLGREVAAGEMAPSAAGFPTSAWLPGDRVAGRLSLALPANLKGGTYRVQIGLLDEGGAAVPVSRWCGSSDWVSVGAVRVEAWPLVTELPDDIQHPLDSVRLAEVMRLRGYDLEQTADALALTLYWQAEQSPGTSYHVFVHLAPPDAPPVAQADGVPVNWQRPTTSWRAGEVIVDAYTIPLTGVEAGQYNLLIGMYDPAAGGLRPKTVVDDEVVPDGYVLLQELEIGQ